MHLGREWERRRGKKKKIQKDRRQKENEKGDGPLGGYMYRKQIRETNEIKSKQGRRTVGAREALYVVLSAFVGLEKPAAAQSDTIVGRTEQSGQR